MSVSTHIRNLVILGMHRSGTSMVSGALASAGFWVGETAEMMGAQADNPKGFFERSDVVELNDSLLGASGASWYDPALPGSESTEQWNDSIETIVKRLGDEPWLIKDPRLAFTWPAWQSRVADTLLVYVYRSPQSVARSLERRNGLPLDYGLALWERYNHQLLSLLTGQDCIAVSYEAFSANPGAELAALGRALEQRGCPVDTSRFSVDEVFDSQLDHSDNGDTEATALMTPSQRLLNEACLSFIETGVVNPSLPALDPVVVPRIHSMANAYRHALDARQIAVELDEKREQMTATLSQLHDTETSLAQVHQAEIAVRSDRDVLQQRHDELLQEHDALAQVHQKDNEELAELRDVAVELADVQAKADYLFHQLDHSYQKLLSYADSAPGKLQSLVSAMYKLVTLQYGRQTAYDDILEDARVHFTEYEQAPVNERVTKFSLLADVFRYVLRNPSGSRRSFSISRLKRALSVFFSSDKDSLALWVNQRFPTRASEEAKAVIPDMGPEMDELELVFPVSDAPRVSIIIPVFNQYRMTIFCLRSVLENSQGIDYEIILADDASSDLTASIESRVSGMVIERAESNRGFVRNCNAGAARARGQYLLFLNNDTGVTPGWLDALCEILDKRPGVGVVGPKLLFGSGELQEAGGIIWDDASGWNYGRMDDAEKPEYNYLKEVDYVSGACLMIRQSLWETLGGFDLRFVPAYYEDTDICFAAREAGFQVIYQPASRVFHFEGLSNGTDLGSGIKQYQVENRVKFLDKWQSVLAADHFPNAESVFQARDRSSKRRCILVIDHYVPSFDKDAGSRSTWMYLQLFVEMGYNVKFVGANFFPHQPYTQALQQLGVEVLVGESISRRFDQWLNEHAEDIHAVYVHRPHVAEQFIGTLKQLNPRPTLIFFGHDLHYLRKERELLVSGERSVEKESRDWRRREFSIFGDMDHVYYPSQVEVEEVLKQSPQTPVQAIPLYVVDDVPQPNYIATERQGMLFVGGFNHPPNVDGIGWFVKEVLPLVRQEMPELDLHIVGSNVPAEVSALTEEGVVVHGYLSDQALHALYGKMQMVVVPLRFGAGVKGKVIEAIQQGVPVVTTSVGAEGLPDADTVLHIADEADRMAAALLNVLKQPEATDSKVAAYTSYLNANFSKSKAGEIIRRDFGEPLLEDECG